MASQGFRGAIEFLDQIGVYDVVLPFLLVFTIVFAILERTKVFGSEKISGKDYPKKNLNALAAFVIALLVVASTQIVSIINNALAKVVLLLILSVFFIVLIGTFFGNGEVKLTKGWRTGGMTFMAAGILAIFAHELGWLPRIWTYLTQWNSSAVGSVLLLVIIAIFIMYITKSEEPPTSGGSGSDEDTE